MADVVKTITGLNFHNYCHIAAALLLDNQITARTDKKINAVELGPGACFSKVPKLFGPISGTTIPFIPSQHRGSKPSNFAILLILLILKACKKISFSKRADCSLTTSFSGPKSVGTFEKRAPVSQKSRELCGPEKPFVKVRPAYSVKLVFSYVVKGIKTKITAKFCASRRLRFEDTKRIMSPEIRPKSFGTFEKQALWSI